jgi:maleylpyruvate isomerase
VTADPLVLVPEVERATTRLVESARTLDGAGCAAASLCPGWTRGHVLTHVSRSADSLVNLLTWARTGVETPQYTSSAVRVADIEAGAGRPIDLQLADLQETATHFAAAVAEMPATAWAVPVRQSSGAEVPAASVVWMRLREVEVHHVDLDAGYGSADWPEAFTLHLLHEVATNFGDRADFAVRVRLPDGQTIHIGQPSAEPATVSGPAHAVAAWLIGRGDGTGLTVSPEGGLPPVPVWK